MAVAAFDTLTVSKDLQQAGIQAKHAEAIALAVKQSQGDLATKQDIAQLRSETKSNIDHLRTELKSDIDHLRTELKSDIDHLKTDIDQLRSETKSNIDHLRTELKSDVAWMKWVLGVNLALSIGIIAAIISG